MKKKELKEETAKRRGLPRALQLNAAGARVRCLSNPHTFHHQNRRTERLTGLQYSLA